MVIDFIKKNIIFLGAALIFILLTLPFALNESSFFDAAWAWYLSKIINFDNWMQILANERHCIIWYLILKPFSVNNFFYPYSLQFINWVFCYSAIIILWKISNSDNIIKILITFSFVMTQFFAVIARCYSVGLLGLFLLIFLQKKSLKHPLLYSLLSGLTANTSAMAAIPVLALTFIFIADIIKKRKIIDKKALLGSALILVSCFSFIVIPFLGGIEWAYSNEKQGFIFVIKEIASVLTFNKFLLTAFMLSYFGIILYILFVAKGRKAKFFIIFTVLLLLSLMSYVYQGTITHKLFFTVYLILAVLLQNEEYKYSKFLPVFFVIFAILLFIPQDIRSIKGMKVNRDLGFYMLQKDNIFENSFVVIEESDIKFTLIPYILQNPKITLLDESDDFMLDYKMRFFSDEKHHIDYSKSKNKPMYLITYYPYKNYEPYMIFENKYKDDDGCERYIYKFE